MGRRVSKIMGIVWRWIPIHAGFCYIGIPFKLLAGYSGLGSLLGRFLVVVNARQRDSADDILGN